MAFNLKTLPDIPTRAVWCTVTSQTAGKAVVRAYDFDGIAPPGEQERYYQVPLYHMTLSTKDTTTAYTFKGIRWGVVIGKRGDYLFAVRPAEYDLIWQNEYMGGKGGWKLVGTKALIHDGANRPRTNPWGAAGCIEVTGRVKRAAGWQDAWQVFNQQVRELSEVPADWSILRAHKLIQKNGSFKCVLKPVVRPRLKRIELPQRRRTRRGR